MRITITFFLVAMIGLVPVCAQNKSTLLQQINEIKSQNELYYWDQYTCPNADSSKYNATKRMLLEINENLSDGQKMSVEQAMPHTKYINIDRGYLKQCFAYMKKSDLANLTNLTNGGVVSTPVIVSAPTNNTTVTVGVPVNTAPAISPVMLPTPRQFVPEAFVTRIMETKYFMDVYKLLKSLQAQGQVLQFGSLKDVDDYSSLDLILFDLKSQEVVTLLSPVTPSGNRINLVEGSEDSLRDYPTEMLAVIWYIKK